MNEHQCQGCRQAYGRRDFLRVGSLSLLGVGLSQYLELSNLMAAAGQSGSPQKAKACILLFLQGGPSQVDTWDPKENSGFKPIGTNVAGIQISELFPRVARQMDRLAVIRSMHTEETDHPQAIHYAMTGHRANPAMQFPSLGSILAKEIGSPTDLPAYALVNMEQGVPVGVKNYFRAAFLGARYDPMMVPDPHQANFAIPDLSLPENVTLEQIEDRRSCLKIVDQLYRQKEALAEYASMDVFTEQALKMILSPQVKKAFDISQESDRTREAYGRHSFGQGVLMARRMVEAGSCFVTAYWHGADGVGNWDTHGKNDQGHRKKAPRLDQTLSTLLEDLHQRGLLESTLVMVMGEFGRTPRINSKGGRDHWPHCWSLVLGGGGIRGGQVIGASDERGAYVAERMVTMGDILATIYKAFGIDWEKTYMTPIGRPLKIATSIGDKTGVPVEGLV